jgi:hypothetical protein
VTSRLGTGKWQAFFYSVHYKMLQQAFCLHSVDICDNTQSPILIIWSSFLCKLPFLSEILSIVVSIQFYSVQYYYVFDLCELALVLFVLSTIVERRECSN